MIRSLIATALVILVFSTFGVSQDSPKPASSGPATSTTYCQGLEAYVKRHPKEARFFGDTSSYDQSGATISKTEKAQWKEYKSAKARDAAATSDNLYDTADVWLRNGKIVLAHFQNGSPSGDWAQFVGYCFRIDGSLAEIHNSFRTFYGSVRIEKTDTFDPRGKMLTSMMHCYDLQSSKPKRCGGSYKQYEAEVFRTSRQLPFYGLVGNRSSID